MALGDNGGDSPNYEPNSFGGPVQNPRYVERKVNLDNPVMGRWDHREHDSDYFTQAGNLFRMIGKEAQQRLCRNIASTLHTVPERIRTLQISHFEKCDPDYGAGVARAVEEALGAARQQQPAAELVEA